MYALKKVVLAALTVADGFCRCAPRGPRDDLDKVLRQLDAAAETSAPPPRTSSSIPSTTEPIDDKDVQKGTVYYEREGSNFQMAAHIREENGKPVPKTVVLSDGVDQAL